MMSAPKSSDLLKIVRRHFPKGAHSYRRFETGLAHYVYEVMRRDGDPVVVRMADPAHWNGIPGGVYWHEKLKPLGVPLPDMIAHDLALPFPYMILERLPGEDLGYVYAGLTSRQKQDLAEEIVSIQDRVAALPNARWFGWLNSYEHPSEPYNSWRKTLDSGLLEAERLIVKAGVFDSTQVDQVRRASTPFEVYFADVQPAPFLDDTTTKNVIIQGGALSGIVDVDNVCFGDRLYVLALTQMALLSSRLDTDYIDFWAEAWALTREQRKIVDLYTAMHCVYFMGEIGQAFNKEKPAEVNADHVVHLEKVLERLLFNVR